MALVISIQRQEPESAVVTVGGTLDSLTAVELDKSLEQLLKTRIRVLALDLAELRFMTSAGVRVILRAQKLMLARRGHFALSRLQPQIAKVLQVVRALPGISIFASDDELDDYLLSMQSRLIGPSP